MLYLECVVAWSLLRIAEETEHDHHTQRAADTLHWFLRGEGWL